MDIMDSTLCRLRCSGGTQEEIATSNRYMCLELRRQICVKIHNIQNQEVIEGIKVD